MAVESVKVLINAEDNASNVFRKVNTNASSSFGKLGGFAKTAGLAVAGIGAAVGGVAAVVGGFAIKSADTFEQGINKYEVLLKSTEAAQERMAQLNTFAAKTPFQLDEIIKGDVILQGFGIRSEEMLKRVGNAAAISGSSFNDLSLIMGQVSQTKDLENIKQLVERGVISFNELKDAGIEFAKNGSIVNSTEETFAAVAAIMDEKFAGGMEKMSQTVSGKWSTIKDTFTLAMADMATNSGLMDFTKNILDFAIEKLPAAMETAKQVIGQFTEKVKLFTDPLMEFFVTNKDAIGNYFNTMKEVGTVAFETIGELATDIFGGLFSFFESNKEFFVNTFNSFANTVKSAFGVIQGAVGVLKDIWNRDFLGITSNIMTTWSTIKYFGTGVFEIFGGIVDTLSYVLNNWEYIWNSMKLTVKEFSNSIVSSIEEFVNAIVSGVNSVLPKWAQLSTIDLSGYKMDTTKEKAYVDALRPTESLGDIWSNRMGNVSTAAETYIQELAQIEKDKQAREEKAAQRDAEIIIAYKEKQAGNVVQTNYTTIEVNNDAVVDNVLRKLDEKQRMRLSTLGGQVS